MRIAKVVRRRILVPVSRGYKILRLRDAPFRSRLKLLRPLRSATTIVLREGAVSFDTRGAEIDLRTFDEVFVHEDYRAEYQDAYVVDVGAHKGYFGAYAALRGALAVFSYEPEEANFRLLSNTAARFRRDGFTWRVHRKGVGKEAGVGTLQVSDESWGHSFLKRSPGAVIQTVDIEPMSRILAALPVGEQVIVKIDVEGMECDIVLGTPVDLWRKVERVFVETHEFASCSWDGLATHLRAAGLTESPDQGGGILRMSRKD